MESNTRIIEKCEVCDNNQVSPVLVLGDHPLCDDLVTIGENRACKHYPIEILFCETCRTAHQRFQVKKSDLFPPTYHYRSRFTADVLRGMKDLVVSVEKRFGSLEGKLVLDVGCNDGSLLELCREQGCRTVGIEPTDAAIDAITAGHPVYVEFLSEDVASKILSEHGRPDFIVFTNVFAHIDDLHAVINSLKTLISSDTVVVIENHYLGAILGGNQFDTFYHEHPRTYSYSSFVYIARLLELGLVGVEFPARYGGNIRVFLGGSLTEGPVSSEVRDILALEASYMDSFCRMSANVELWRKRKVEQISKLVEKYGKIRAKAFPGRAAILVKLLGLDESMIEAVYEKSGSMKIGNYVPGTRIPIISDDVLWDSLDMTSPIINMAWHISEEIGIYLRESGYAGEVIDIISPSDFEVG